MPLDNRATANQVRIISDAAMSLIGQLFIEGYKAGYTSPDGKHPYHLLWMLWNESVPLPTRHTMPIWMYICELIPGWQLTGSTYYFMLPQSTPLSAENIPDVGDDSILTTKALPFAEKQYLRVKSASRARMHALSDLLVSQPVIRVVNHQPSPVNKAIYMRELSEEILKWKASASSIRRTLAEYIGILIGNPFDSERIRSVTGNHLHDLRYNGLFMRGDYLPHEPSWCEGESVKIAD